MHSARHVAEQVRARRTILGVRRPVRRRLPRQAEPNAIRLEYFRGLRAILDRAKRMVDELLVPRLASLLAESRVDGVVELVADWDGTTGTDNRAALAALVPRAARLDAGGKKANEIVDQISERFFRELQPEAVERFGEQVAGKVASFAGEQLDKQVKAAFGVDVFVPEPDLNKRTANWVAENVALIKSIPNKYLDDVEAVVTRGIRQAATPKQIADELQERYEISTRRAMLIARDQTSRLNGQMQEARQTALGVTHYLWRTLKDNRVREEHEDLEGDKFAWDDPPSEGHPGDAIQCRCYAEPVLDDILGEL